MDTLISADELAAQLATPDYLIFDCRFSLMDFEAGRRAYLENHIPGSYYVDLNKDLSAPHLPGKTGRHPLPEKAVWISQVQAWGISPQKQVIVYDDANGAIASRMWWMLRWLGHDKVAVLNGGLPAWEATGHPLTSELSKQQSATGFHYASLPSLTKLVEADSISSEQQTLLDARELPRFSGKTEPIDPIAGHITGALCSPFSGNLNEEGLLKSPEALREKFSDVATSDKPVVCYCGSGVTAAHNILAMTLAGFPEPSLYAGSWSEWITDPNRAISP